MVWYGLGMNNAQSTADTLSDWDLIVACLHHNGVAKDLVAFPMNFWRFGDGYGEFSSADLREMEVMGDWSHIRDSSEKAQQRIADQLAIYLTDHLVWGLEGLRKVRRLIAENGSTTMNTQENLDV